MSFTVSNIAAFEQELKSRMGALLAPQQVDLYGGGTETIRLHVSTRRANETDISGGAVADTQLIATIDADDWDTKAGRPPQKGDVIWWTGLRHAVDRSAVSAPAGNKAFYKVRLEG